jgi:uncharacterized protein DUF1801
MPTKVTVPAEVEKLIAEHPPDVRAIELAIREKILATRHDLGEEVDWGNRLLGYSVGPRMADLVFAIIAHKAHVNLQLADGVDLPDPDGIVEGTGKRIRHVKLRSLEDVGRPAVQRLIEEEIAIKGK